MLHLDHLRKEFKNIVAVDDLSLEIHPGKIYGLLGPNGAGKTTTIRCILNIIKPTSGSITYNNEQLSAKLFPLFGYLPEERGLYKKSRTGDVIRYLAGLKGMSSRSIKTKMDFWTKRLDIADIYNRRIEELSKGNQQKVQFITAVIHDPQILVLDEPFTGFDPINQQIVRENILQFKSEGKIIVLSTHRMETAEELCDEILLMNRGREILKGDLASVKQKFAGNFIRIGYSGSGDFLKGNKNIVHAEYYNGYAEVQLQADVSPSAFLKEISGQSDILHFSIIEPALNKIFIDSIKESSYR
jgi:ABC-2 type transport system ATP-binding protein